jgi:hypothetical protein
MKKFFSSPSAWLMLVLSASYLCVSLLIRYFDGGKFNLNWNLVVAALVVPALQTLLLRLFRRIF